MSHLLPPTVTTTTTTTTTTSTPTLEDSNLVMMNTEADTMDPDDPNFKKLDVLHKLKEAYTTLPEGWKKNPKVGGSGEPPFLHEDGRTSWKNPNFDVMTDILKQAEQEEQKELLQEGCAPTKKRGLPEHAQRRLLKKYRMMLKSGVPVKAIEQTAELDGVDPTAISELLMAADGNMTTNSTLYHRPASSFDNIRHGQLVKKYKKMIQSGVPLAAVKSMARRELKMDNVDAIFEQETTAAAATSTCGKDNIGPVTIEDDDADIDNHRFFEPKNGGATIEFKLGSIGKESHLALLVRKMALTVKRGRLHGMKESASTLLVEAKDLYDALGALHGVQMARDLYNSTTITDQTKAMMSDSEVRSNRKPFLELIASLGIRAPTRPNDKVDIQGLDSLISYIEDKFKNELKVIQDSLKIGMYDFESLAQLYKPGTRVLAKHVFASGVDMICEVRWNRYEQGMTLGGITRSFKVCFQFIVAVGEHYTMCEFVDTIENFEGARPIKTMNHIPLAAYGTDAIERITKAYRHRGEMYASCATGAKYMSYDKGSFHAKGGRGGSDRTTALRTHGRVMVDTQGSYEAGHSLGIGNDLMVMGIKYKYKEYMLHMRAQKKAKQDGDTSPSDDDDLVLFETIPSIYLDMTWPAVIGFSFTSKTWGEVLVDGLSEIEFDESVFDNLVLPASRKRMVKALVRHSNDCFNDLISGKGEGSVFLLYGPPGCGKTLTAEAISEMLHRPLYTVSLGQLGTTPAELETRLGEILDLCNRWDALILLDEADIFLEKRTSTGSLERNAMVSIMLRLVEYFKGVLFLTSNRVEALDPAFKTRITLALRYEPLDTAARKQVWNNLLYMSGFAAAVTAGTINLDELSTHVLNGREIKNALRLGIALAEEDGKELSQSLILETINILNDFNEKMKSAEAY